MAREELTDKHNRACDTSTSVTPEQSKHKPGLMCNILSGLNSDTRAIQTHKHSLCGENVWESVFTLVCMCTEVP